MATKIVFRGQQTTTTASGTNLTLIAAATGYENFNPTCGNGDSFYGILELQDKQWEAGLFTIVGLYPTVVSRPTTPIASSTTFTMTAGTHTLKCCDMQGSAFPDPNTSNFDFHNAYILNAYFNKAKGQYGDIIRNANSASGVLNMNYGGFSTITLNADVSYSKETTLPDATVALPNSGEAQTLIIEVIQDNAGGHTFTLNAPFAPYTDGDSATVGVNIDLTPYSKTYIVLVNNVYTVIKKPHLVVNSIFDVDYDVSFPKGFENSIVHRTSADTTARTWTIPANSAEPFRTGTKMRLLNMGASGNVSVPITTDTLKWLPTGGTGTRTIAPNGYLDIEKITDTMWICSGVGVT